MSIFFFFNITTRTNASYFVFLKHFLISHGILCSLHLSFFLPLSFGINMPILLNYFFITLVCEVLLQPLRVLVLVAGHWIIVMELYPAFSLYRGIYELAQYSLMGSATGTQGMQWRDLSDPENGMRDVCIIMMVEWLVVLFIAYDIDQQRISSRNGVTARVLLFLQNIWKRSRNGVKRRILCLMLGIWKKSNLKSQKFSAVSPQVENIDVFEEVITINSYTYSWF